MSSSRSEWVTVDDLARILHSSPGALYAQRSRGMPPGALGVKVGQRVLYRLADIDEWFDRCLTDEAANG